jgi:molybdopterin synthase catalytic subunit
VTFIGTVRGTNHGKQVVRLEYEAYAEMAVRQFGVIAAQAKEKFSARVAIHHRIGPLVPGETSVIVAAASPHRADAFDACRFAIEALKQDATIWKREIYPDGSTWVGLGS